MTIRGFLGLGILIYAIASSPVFGEEWRPTNDEIRVLESKLVWSLLYARNPETKKPLEPLAKYDRFYAVSVQKGRRLTIGVLLFAPSETRTGVHIVPEKALPDVMDGGCGIVNLFYDPAQEKILSITCNGVG